jgi:SAM-dependent methyltransferase
MQPKNDLFTCCIERFIQDSSKQVKDTDKILDAGAGDCPYKKYFINSMYDSTDITGYHHTFYCSLDNIPVINESYDVVVCTQVLEHVKYPQKAMNEFYRILRPGGKLYLTAPQGWKLHGEPDHYFNFTRYGLELLFKDAGFKVTSICPQGGVFWYLYDIIRTLPIPMKQIFLLFLFHLDKFDKEQKFTMGYTCCCVKEKQ